MAEPNFLLEFRPSRLIRHRIFVKSTKRSSEMSEGSVESQVVVRLGFAVRPFDQQPLFIRGLVPLGVVMGRTHQHEQTAMSAACCCRPAR